MITRSRGFTLIELLVVVAIIGILAGVGIVAYSGYVDASKKKSAQNIMMQISLANTEYYSDNSSYYSPHSNKCTPNNTSSTNIETNLLNSGDVITDEIGYNMCVYSKTINGMISYVIAAETAEGKKSRMTLDGNQTYCKENCTD